MLLEITELEFQLLLEEPAKSIGVGVTAVVVGCALCDSEELARTADSDMEVSIDHVTSCECGSWFEPVVGVNPVDWEASVTRVIGHYLGQGEKIMFHQLRDGENLCGQSYRLRGWREHVGLTHSVWPGINASQPGRVGQSRNKVDDQEAGTKHGSGRLLELAGMRRIFRMLQVKTCKCLAFLLPTTSKQQSQLSHMAWHHFVLMG